MQRTETYFIQLCYIKLIINSFLCRPFYLLTYLLAYLLMYDDV